MVNPDELVGRRGRPFDLHLEPGKMREFARATGASHQLFYGAEPTMHPTFLMTAAFWTVPDNLPLHGLDRNLQRVVHGAQSFRFIDGPPRGGLILTGEARIESAVVRTGRRGGRMSIIDVVTEFRNHRGGLVAEGRGTSIETGLPDEEAE